MKLKHYFLIVFLFCTTCVFASNSLSSPAIYEQDVFSGIMKDKDFSAYLKCRNFNTYPLVLKHAGKVYAITSPGAALKDMPAGSLVDQPVFEVTSFKVKENDKVRVKISYLNKKFLITANQLCCSKWAVRSLLAREAGGIKPEWYSLK